MYDQLRKEWITLYNMSTELQEAIITWLQIHPEEYKRIEQRLKERNIEAT